MEFIPLHAVPKFMTECAELLNDEWKRSLTARLHSLEKSKDNFPICLLLLQKNGTGKQDVIGHVRLSDVRGLPTKSCLIESVVVRKIDRGKGYGKILMEKSEQFAARKGYQVMYLTTHDKQDFYSHIGYQFCKPIVSTGSSIMPDGLAQKLIGNMSLEDSGPASKKEVVSPLDNQNKCDGHVTNVTTPPIPPAPPLPNAPSHSNSSFSPQAPPPAPPIPPAPPLPTNQPSLQAPPPPPSISQAPPISNVPPVPNLQALLTPQAPPPPKAPTLTTPSLQGPAGDKNVVRWDPSKVSWMKKDISSSAS